MYIRFWHFFSTANPFSTKWRALWIPAISLSSVYHVPIPTIGDAILFGSSTPFLPHSLTLGQYTVALNRFLKILPEKQLITLWLIGNEREKSDRWLGECFEFSKPVRYLICRTEPSFFSDTLSQRFFISYLALCISSGHTFVAGVTFRFQLVLVLAINEFDSQSNALAIIPPFTCLLFMS